MLEGKAMVEDSDMPVKMQMQEFDERYGSGWQCVVGSNFGCFFTHSKGTFIYFQLETLKFLIFKGASTL
ncbi:Dynein light chain type 1/2 [Arabidopsis thaliana x Arabidopsis arenosa]|uniref:Dynein light chain n=1 Tax=Arabidopsis thaliana x Arabidopsis arenosa TaxID=1240361 RepID=A0A8T2CA19_9BRAS|nr:Dynein light chain type 1/2 [Arabidopsis thaliana x Arabidopsis arenosa]